ncbi:MAG TPA: hypothetical protein VJ817_12955 [Gemmatimonadales bacterium]|nr:hypothetical protein [Gemmatimonadales bacterium]
MSRFGLVVLLLSAVAGYFGLGAVAGSPATAALALLGIFLAVFLVTLAYELGSRRRWMV